MQYLKYLGIIFLCTFILCINWYCINNIDFFDYSLTDLGVVNWSLAPYVSRLALGFLGALPLISVAFPAIKRTIVILSVALSLFMALVSLGETMLCSLERPYLALYELWPLSKWQGAVWILFSLIALFSLRSSTRNNPGKPAQLLSMAGAILFLALPFVLNYPPSWAVYGEQAERNVSKTLQLDSLYQVSDYTKHIDSEKQILQGKKLICFASLTCPYCSRLAYKLHIIKESNPKASMLLVLTGDSSKIQRFEEKSACKNVPRLFIKPEYFARWFGGSVPLVFMANGKQTHTELEYWALNDSHLIDEKLP
jgi:hypothetical protein